MKKLALAIPIHAQLFAGTWIASTASVQGAGITVSIAFDEFGKGFFASPILGTASVPGALVADPGPGGLASALTYDLLGPPSLVAGDVRLLDIGTAVVSDILRFNPAGTGVNYPASLVFYSTLPLVPGAQADTGLPSALYTNTVSFTEVVFAPGILGLVYHPTSTQPGFIEGFDVTYTFISDTPEPATLTMLVLGWGAILAWRPGGGFQPVEKTRTD